MKKYLIIASIALTAIGCNRENAQQPINTDSPSTLTGSTFTYQDMVNSYTNTPGLIGVINLTQTQYNDFAYQEISPGNFVATPTDGISRDVRATFRAEPFGASGTGLSISNFNVNASNIREYTLGTYSKIGPDNLDLYFGGGWNKFKFENNSHFNGFKDSLEFAAPVTITNITRGTQVSKANDLTVAWAGSSPSAKIQVSIQLANVAEPGIANGSVTMLNFYMNNVGSFTIAKQLLQQLPKNCHYDVSVYAFEPKTIQAPNNKKIIAIGETIYKTTIELTN